MMIEDAVRIVRDAFKKEVSNPDILIDINVTNTGRIFGFIVSDFFHDMDSIERAEYVSNVLKTLSEDIRQLVTIIFANTHKEFEETDTNL
jgi:hypothetical protein